MSHAELRKLLASLNAVRYHEHVPMLRAAVVRRLKEGT